MIVLENEGTIEQDYDKKKKLAKREPVRVVPVFECVHLAYYQKMIRYPSTLLSFGHVLTLSYNQRNVRCIYLSRISIPASISFSIATLYKYDIIRDNSVISNFY